ncbi:universal stress protein [Lacinutrix sp. C3R15]|uniref:universal stress protein n=1 Tax=Flavobacteriaceae TaxID=49546 RepID=UPI001C0A559F|nr:MULTISPECIES: universal stress protein [Flavobacteriaceae]MBU2937947.1 universal stress protein [Lacinutrix sp. C3R15]MDO6621261.1 universal stress protein [Oceanihabitans sp. 1_MG-2023]
MKNILVPIGSSANAKNTLQYAIEFATVMQANVYVFRAFSLTAKAGAMINLDSIVAREQVASVKAVVDKVDTKNINVQIISAKGGVIDSLETIQKELGIDLVIVGQRPNGLQEAYFLGRVAGSLVKQTDIPVLVIPNGYVYKPIKKVLTAIKSGIVKNKVSVKPLEDIIETFKAKMHLLQVKTQDFLPEDLEFYSELAILTSSYNSSENATLFQGVLEHINKHNPDIICVFRRKRGFFKKLWEQNTIKKIDFESRVPLLVLKGAE